MKKKIRNRIIAGAFITVIVIVCISAAVVFWPKTDSTLPPGGSIVTDDNFITVKDGMRNLPIDDDDVICSEYRLPVGEDAEDWSEWEQNTDVTDAEDVEMDDFTSAYSRIVLTIAANNTDIGDDEDVDYYTREVEIFDNVVNTIYLYETPKSAGIPAAGFVCFNSNNLTVITTASTNISANLNFTLVAFINVTQTNAKWVGYWSFISNDYARLSFVFTFNATVASSDIICKTGYAKTRPTTTTLAFSFDSLGIGGATSRYEWGASPSDIVIDSNTPIVLQFNEITI
jgi:hypothetical protein